MKNTESFGNKLRTLRTGRLLTQQQLAEKLHLSRHQIKNYELGLYEPDLSTLKRISDFFSVSIDYLLDVDSQNSASLEKSIKKLKDTYYAMDKQHRDNFTLLLDMYISFLEMRIADINPKK